MLTVLIRILCALPAILFFYQGVNWLFQPAEAAAGLGMSLLAGIGASSQIGDLGSFFLVNSVLMAIGQFRGRSYLLYIPAGFIGIAGIFRVLAAAMGHADFAAQLIVSEAILTIILVVAARHLRNLEN